MNDPTSALPRPKSAAATERLALERARAKPDISPFAGYKRVGNDNTLLLGVNIPLKVRDRNQAEIARAEADIKDRASSAATGSESRRRGSRSRICGFAGRKRTGRHVSKRTAQAGRRIANHHAGRLRRRRNGIVARSRSSANAIGSAPAIFQNTIRLPGEHCRTRTRCRKGDPTMKNSRTSNLLWVAILVVFVGLSAVGDFCLPEIRNPGRGRLPHRRPPAPAGWRF